MTSDTFAKLLLIFYVVLLLVTLWWRSGRCRGGRVVWLLASLSHLYCGLMFRVRADGANLPQTGPALVIGNHQSPLDPMLIWDPYRPSFREGGARPIGFLMLKMYYDVGWLTWMYDALRSIPVVRDGNDTGPVRQALRQLKKGELVGIFPESRFNPNPQCLMPGDSGAAWIALKAQVPVYPVFIENLPHSDDMIRPFFQPRRVRVRYGEPIDLSAYATRRKNAETLREVTDLLMQRLAQLGGVGYSASELTETSRDRGQHGVNDP